MADLPNGFRGIRFHSGRQVPRGTTIKVTMIGPIPFVEGAVLGGPQVAAPCAVVDQEIVLDDALFFPANALTKLDTR